MGITLCDRADVCCCLEGINIRSLLWRCCSRAAPPEPPRTKSRGRVDLPHALLYLDWLFFCLLQKPKDCVRENILYLPLGVWNSHWAPLNQVQVHETCWAEARASTCESLPATWTLASIQWRSSWRKSSTSHSEIFTTKRSTLTQRSISEDVK